MSQPKVISNRQNIMEITNLIDLKFIMGSCVTVIAGFTTPSTSKNLKIFIRKFLKRKAEQFPLITFVYMEVSDADRNTLNILKGSLSDYPRIYHIRGGNNITVEVKTANEETITESFKQVEMFYIDEMKAFQQHMKNKSKSDYKINNDNESDEKIDSADQITSDDFDDDNDNDNDNDGKHVSPKTQIKKITTKNNQKPPSHNINNKNKTNNNKQIDSDQNDNNISADVEEKHVQTPQTQPKPDPALEKKKNLEKLVLLNKKCDELKLDMVREIAKRKKIEIALDKKNDEEKKDDGGKEYRKSLRKTIK